MANQEFPIFILRQGATLLGDTFLPQVNRGKPAANDATRTGSVDAPHGVMDRLDAWFWRQRQRANEAYLAQSQDIFELERRMRALERNVGDRYY